MSEAKYAIAEHVNLRQTNASMRIMFDRNEGVMYELNETASAVMEILEKGSANIDSIAEAIALQFEGQLEDFKPEIDSLLKDFVGNGLVVVLNQE